MNDQTRLSPAQVAAAGLAEWRQIRHTLRARFRTGDFARGLELINRIGDAAERRNHHPDITLTYPEVGVSLTSHDLGGITGRDIDLAREISTIAADLGIGHDTSITDVDLALDTDDQTAVVGFYAALLDAKDTGSGDLAPGQAPPMWFQEPSTDTPLLPPASPPQRWHLDVWVPIDEAEARVDAILAAGGTLVSDAMAPSFWVVEDADGNRSCVCSVAGPLEG